MSSKRSDLPTTPPHGRETPGSSCLNPSCWRAAVMESGAADRKDVTSQSVERTLQTETVAIQQNHPPGVAGGAERGADLKFSS